MLVGISSHFDVKVSIEVVKFRKFAFRAIEPQRNEPHIVDGALLILLDAVMSVSAVAAAYSILLRTNSLQVWSRYHVVAFGVSLSTNPLACNNLDVY